ncbi:MAG: glycerophosphodiester phosphodiesterase [Thermodesulfovibrionales bacterium]|nr:glycerophosphodiester phosphodiesterase [Thermodesulfovibrionales bacterium]
MFLKVGHRGARAYEIENTVESFKRAIELGVNAVELDVRKSKDGKLVIIHDDNLKKVFGKDIQVNEATLKKLKQLTENKILTLEEALKFIGKKVEKILVELKEVGYEKKVLEVIKKEKLKDVVIIVSFREQALFNVRKLDKEIETGLIYSKYKNPIDVALKLNAQYLVPLYRFTHTKDIEKAHKNNLRVIVWTINTKQEVKEYIAKGVDGIASDKPDIF